MQKQLALKKISQYIALSGLVAQLEDVDNTNLTSAIIDLEEEILINFGLPSSAYKYTSAMESYCLSNDDINQATDKLYRHLKNEAITYLTSPIKSDIEILLDGRERMLHANEVIPFTGYGT
jgi:hypothetical protein